jgi:hypothetical protein
MTVTSGRSGMWNSLPPRHKSNGKYARPDTSICPLLFWLGRAGVLLCFLSGLVWYFHFTSLFTHVRNPVGAVTYHTPQLPKTSYKSSFGIKRQTVRLTAPFIEDIRIFKITIDLKNLLGLFDISKLLLDLRFSDISLNRRCATSRNEISHNPGCDAVLIANGLLQMVKWTYETRNSRGIDKQSSSRSRSGIPEMYFNPDALPFFRHPFRYRFTTIRVSDLHIRSVRDSHRLFANSPLSIHDDGLSGHEGGLRGRGSRLFLHDAALLSQNDSIGGQEQDSEVRHPTAKYARYTFAGVLLFAVWPISVDYSFGEIETALCRETKRGEKILCWMFALFWGLVAFILAHAGLSSLFLGYIKLSLGIGGLFL